MSNVRLLIIILTATSITSMVCAQNSPGLKSFIPPSPNASSLGKYGEVPVGYYTGIPNISIPLASIKSRDLELPVSLSYHAGGIRVEEVASWVGLGWSLNAGGVITRSVRGVPDDRSNGYFNTRTTINALGIKYKDYVNSYIDHFLFGTGNGLPADVLMYEQIMAQVTDAEPDIFYFNFGNFSGKFFMNSAGSFVVSPIQALKIEQISNGYGVTRWIITTPDGVRYIFGTSLDQSRNALEKTINESNTVSSSGWYLIEVLSPNNSRIDLYYTAETYSYQSKASETINRIVYDANLCNLPPLDRRISTNYFEGWRLAKIQGSNGDITFNKALTERNDLPGSYALASLDIRDAQSTVVKTFKLTYSDFFSSSGCGTQYCKRLKLDAVEETSANGLVTAGKHMFEYSTLPLPDRNPNLTAINSQDMWGFYNGASNSVLPRGGTIFSDLGPSQTIFGGDRHSDEYFMQAGTLTKITYPTGGYTYFDYEANRLYSSDTNLGFTNLAPIAKSASLTLLTGETKTQDFSVIYADPSTSLVRVTITNRQQIQNCPATMCYQMYVENRNSPGKIYLAEGTQTLDLPAGDYRIGGTTFSGFESTVSTVPKVYYLNLNWLEYPTTVSSTQSEDKIVGGLRIKRISNFSGVQAPIVKRYEYSKFSVNQSSGVAVNIAMLNADSFSIYNCIPSGPFLGCTITSCGYVQFRSATLVPLTPTSGGIVGYANVTELLGENGEGGKTEYTFTTALDHPDENKNFKPFPASASYDWRRGLLSKKSEYKKTSTGFVKVAEAENTYSFGNNPVETYGLAVIKDHVGGDNIFADPGSHYYVAGYKTVSEFFYLQTEKYRIYDQTALTPFLETTKTNEYGIPQGHYQLTRSTEVGSDGVLKEVTIKYAQDVSLIGEPETARQSLINKFMIGTVLEQTAKTGGVQTAKTTTDYKDFNSALTLPAKVSFQTESPAPLEERVNFSTYDDYGNILEQAKKDDFKNGYQYGYNNSLPTAEVKNASNYKSSLNQTGIAHVNFGGAAPSPTYNFTVDYTGTVTLKLSVQGTPTYSTIVTYSGMSSGSATLLKGGCGLTTITFTNITPGAKSLTLALSSPDGGSVLGACGQIDYPQKQIIKEFYLEDFEESALATTDLTLAHTGRKYFSGDYTVNFALPNARSYFIEYWYLDAINKWQYISKPFTGTSMLLAEGSAIDDVRIYPKDAQMKSYTYDTILGMTSSISESSQTFKYEYDTFGRLKLIRNDKGEIEKQYSYNHKTN